MQRSFGTAFRIHHKHEPQINSRSRNIFYRHMLWGYLTTEWRYNNGLWPTGCRTFAVAEVHIFLYWRVGEPIRYWNPVAGEYGLKHSQGLNKKKKKRSTIYASLVRHTNQCSPLYSWYAMLYIDRNTCMGYIVYGGSKVRIIYYLIRNDSKRPIERYVSTEDYGFQIPVRAFSPRGLNWCCTDAIYSRYVNRFDIHPSR